MILLIPNIMYKKRMNSAATSPTSSHSLGPALIVLSWVLFVPAGSIRADGYRNPPPGPDSLARSGIDTASSSGSAAIARNPANLVELTAPELMLGADFARLGAEYSAPDGRASSLKDRTHVLPFAFFGTPFDHDWAGGVGIYSPYGQSVEWKEPMPFPSPGFAELRMLEVSPALAWKPSKELSLGLALDLYAADLEIRQSFPWSSITGPGTPDGRIRIDADGETLGASAGITWLPANGHRVSVSWKKGVDLTVDGEIEVTRPVPLPLPPSVGAPSDFSSQMHFPDQVSGAWRMPLLPGLGLELGAEWLGWSSNDVQPLYAGANQSLLQTSALEQHWQDTVNLGVSIDYALNDRWTLMAGYTHHKTPIPDSYYNLVIPDADRHIASTGFSWAEGPQRFNAGVSFSRFADSNIADNMNPAFNGTYELESTLWGIAYTRTFR